MPTVPSTMGADEITSLLLRNTTASVTVCLGEHPRTTRVQYAYAANRMYLPAWTDPDPFYRAPEAAVTVDVSEVDGLRTWRYVWLVGIIAPLQPTGAAAEREAWSHGIAELRRVMPRLSPTDRLAVANFALFRIEVRSLEGAMLKLM